MSDAKEFMLIADKNSDNKVSKVELFELFKNVMRKWCNKSIKIFLPRINEIKLPYLFIHFNRENIMGDDKVVNDQPPEILTMAMMRAIRMRIKTMSMQNLWGFLIF